jgi:hypothetical protein
MPRYIYLQTTEVDQSVRDLADRALAGAAWDLKIATPAIGFFRLKLPTDAASRPSFTQARAVLGLCSNSRDTVFVNALQSRASLIETIAHECRHAAGGGEGAAYEYEARFANWFDLARATLVA